MGIEWFRDFECKHERTVGGLCGQHNKTFISMEYVRFVGQLREIVSCSNSALFQVVSYEIKPDLNGSCE
jgi:hypothetical protein